MLKKICFITTFLFANCHAYLQDVPHITISASASVKKAADELQLKIKVTTHKDVAEMALLENSEKMQQIFFALKDLGFSKDEYETLQFSIQPTYTPYPHNPPANWQPTINGYEVTNCIYVHTQTIDKIGELIDAATRCGATQIYDIQFGLKDPRKHWQEALAEACNNAKTDAYIIATSLGTNLGKILSITTNQYVPKSPHIPMACFAKMSMAPPIEAADVGIEASIQVIYQID
jgi:uncharacterized protein YggE